LWTSGREWKTHGRGGRKHHFELKAYWQATYSDDHRIGMGKNQIISKCQRGELAREGVEGKEG